MLLIAAEVGNANAVRKLINAQADINHKNAEGKYFQIIK